MKSKFKDLLINFFLGYKIDKTQRIVFIIVTSKTEIRVFSPFLDFFAKSSHSFKVEIIILKDEIIIPNKWHFYSNNFEMPISISYDLNILIRHRYLKSAASLLSLDFNVHPSSHSLGIQVVKYINSFNCIKTICMQHGSLRNDNIQGHLSSNSKYQFVFGKFIYKFLKNSTSDNELNVRIVGNPFFDRFKTDLINKRSDFSSNTSGKSIILLASCMHTEYDHLPNSDFLYGRWLLDIIETIDFNKFYLIIKPHPYDSGPDIYKNIMENHEISPENYEINLEINFYVLLTYCDILITRASTTAEDGLILNKKVIAFDNVDKGPLQNYDFIKISGVHVANNKVQLVHGLLNRKTSINSENLIEDIIYKFDGKNTLRMLKEVDKIISI